MVFYQVKHVVRSDGANAYTIRGKGSATRQIRGYSSLRQIIMLLPRSLGRLLAVTASSAYEKAPRAAPRPRPRPRPLPPLPPYDPRWAPLNVPASPNVSRFLFTSSNCRAPPRPPRPRPRPPVVVGPASKPLVTAESRCPTPGLVTFSCLSRTSEEILSKKLDLS